jgi:nucleotide sugar dehydrogenase
MSHTYISSDFSLQKLNQKNSYFDALPPIDPSAVVCIIGVGYVGETLLRAFSQFYRTIGFDVSPKRIAFLKDTIKEQENITLTSSPSALAEGTHFLISVPTLLKPDNSIDTSYITSALSTVTAHARPGSTIVIESTVSVGMTRILLSAYLPTYNCGMSPERVDPGRTFPTAHSIPKVISGLTPASLSSIQSLYAPVFSHLVPVSSPETAEMTKLYENCFRMVNIAYVNEIADACAEHGINVHEVVDAAATKPFGFMPFQPSLGVGGHCIPINPHYLKVNCNLPVLEKATKRMASRPARLASQFYRSVCERTASRPRILVVGLAFKPGQSLTTGSPAVAFGAKLSKLGCAELDFIDPLVEGKKVGGMQKVGKKMWSRSAIEESYDGVAIYMKQTGVDFRILKGIEGVKVRWFCRE